MSTLTREAMAIASMTDELVHRLPNTAPDLVHQVVADALQEFADARVRDFVPLLVARAAADRIRLMGTAGKSSPGPSAGHPRSA